MYAECAYCECEMDLGIDSIDLNEDYTHICEVCGEINFYFAEVGVVVDQCRCAHLNSIVDGVGNFKCKDCGAEGKKPENYMPVSMESMFCDHALEISATVFQNERMHTVAKCKKCHAGKSFYRDNYIPEQLIPFIAANEQKLLAGETITYHWVKEKQS